MEILEQLLGQLFSDPARGDLIQGVLCAVVWFELKCMRKAMEQGFAALTSRVDNHEKRLVRIEDNDDGAAGTAD